MNCARKYSAVYCDFQGYREVPERLRLHPEHISQGGDPQSWLEYSWHHLHTARDLAQANKFKSVAPSPLKLKSWAPGPPSQVQRVKAWSPSNNQVDGTFKVPKLWSTFKVPHVWHLQSTKTVAPTHLQHLGRIRLR